MTAEFAGRHPDEMTEGLREVALVRESGHEGDLDEGDLGRCELTAGEFDPQPSDVIARGAAVMPAEDAGKVHGVDIDGRGDLSERQFLRKSAVEQLARAAEPRRGLRSSTGEGCRAASARISRTSPSMARVESAVRASIFPVEASCEPGCHTAPEIRRPIETRTVFANRVGPGP